MHAMSEEGFYKILQELRFSNNKHSLHYQKPTRKGM